MFTGLIQSVGKVHSIGQGLLSIKGCEPFSPLSLGDSIAVDGVCLTVSQITTSGFQADVSPETLKRTTLGDKAKYGSYVNLEPALRLSDRLGGHLVSGHIDAKGKVLSIQKNRNAWDLEICWEEHLFGKYICEKASICVDGISLTVADSSNNGVRFTIAVIPHTWSATSLKYLQIGELVNLEADIMAKYAESLIRDLGVINSSGVNSDSLIHAEWLRENGWS